MNILIIEDDTGLGKRIGDAFSQKVLTNRIKVVHDFEEFMEEYTSIGLYDIVLTDLNLGNYTAPEGFRIIKKIRENNQSIPIIVISGYDDIDKLRYAFSLGISDYMIKPIRLKELEVRVLNWYHVHCYNQLNSTGKQFSYKGLIYKSDQNKFFFNGKNIALSKNNKYILSIFFSQPERLLTEQYLSEKIWGDIDYSGDRNLRVNIMRLKQKLAPYGIDTWIQNIRGEGYIFME